MALEFLILNGNFIVDAKYSYLLVDNLKKIYEIKQNKHHHQPRLDYFTNEEAILIKKYIGNKPIKVASKNNTVGTLRRFLIYCSRNSKIKTDDLVFEYLKQYCEPAKTVAKAVTDEHLILIHNYLNERAKTSKIHKLVLAIFHILLQTEFRISQICNLKIDCIQSTIKPNQFRICSHSKTSNGLKDECMITPFTYKCLADIIEDTQDMREAHQTEDASNYIFIYQSKLTKAKEIRVISLGIVKNTITEACKACNIPKFNCSNLRDTHMTKALEHVIRNGKNELEMSILSRHKKFDTTTNHYIAFELEKMLESTYGIIIGKDLVDAKSKIVENLPKHLSDAKRDVESGCGKCSVKNCKTTNALGCLTCKYFVTTPKHRIFFEKTIKTIDMQIHNTTNRHDIEDLTTIKRLHMMYLRAILEYEEENNHAI